MQTVSGTRSDRPDPLREIHLTETAFTNLPIDTVTKLGLGTFNHLPRFQARCGRTPLNLPAVTMRVVAAVGYRMKDSA
jgi:hypothetical protein